MAANRNAYIWEGVYRSFAEAGGDVAVFAGDGWIDKIVERAGDALGKSSCTHAAIPEVGTTAEYALPFVASMAATSRVRLRILDFGGGMATSYLPLRAILPADRPLDFVIVENEAICRKGADIFRDCPEVCFRSDVPAPPETVSIVHCGSSIHYVDDWTRMLERFARLKPEFLIFADLPAADIPSFVTVQNYYGRRIPVHFWNIGQFITAVSGLGFEIIFQSRYRGYWLDKDGVLPTSNFDDEHRLMYVSQLIFRTTAR